jgi:hypothetical protein
METPIVKIYASGIYPRLKYAAGLVFENILGLKWEIVTDRRKLGKNPSVNYSDEKIPNAFKITPSGLLSETGIGQKEINVTQWRSLPVFFQSPSDSDIPFDIFSAAFYIVARYEEYSNNDPDEFGRFKASSSLAFRNGFLNIPVVDLWAREFAISLIRRFPALAIRKNQFRSLLTIDTDQPFAYLGKNIFRSMGGMIRDLTLNTDLAADRYKVVTRDKKDPFEVFDYITDCTGKSGTEIKFFFPVGDHSKYDKNPSWKNDEYRTFMNRIGSKYDFGLHPSFNSAADLSLLETELKRLRSVTGREVTSSRYHYIRLMTPASYRNLVKAGVKEDYSMGYPEEPGFRAGIARPYHFYDVAEDKPADLLITPFQVMDATLFQYKKLNAGEAKETIADLIAVTKKAGGLFVSLWHNTSLLDNEEWSGWRELFESMLNLQRS